MKQEVFEQINIRTPRERIYARLGYARGKTELSEKDIFYFESYLNFALDKVKLSGAAATLEIQKIEKGKIFLEEGLIIESNSLKNFLSGCQEILFLGASAGYDIIKVISGQKEKQGLTKAVVADAVASEMVDASLGWIMDYKARGLRRQNKVLTQQRFSAGYGDFSLENQKIIYNILNLEKIGIKLKKSYMLEPEKSVTAACGIKQLLGESV